MIVISELQKQVAVDLEFDIENADRHALRLAVLRDKYSRLAVTAELDRVSAENELKAAYRTAWKHYMSEVPYKVDRRDVDILIEGDEKYAKAKGIYEYSRQVVKYIDKTMQAIDRAGYNIGAAIKWAVFKGGG